MGKESLNHTLSVLQNLNLILEKLTLKLLKIKIALFFKMLFSTKILTIWSLEI